MTVSVLWSSGNEGGSEISQTSRVCWKQHGVVDRQAGLRPQFCYLPPVSMVDQLASPSFSSLICNKMRVTVILS